jgi:uncharacterized protein YbbC (DUF1343 family)
MAMVVLNGTDRADNVSWLKGKRLGLLTSPSGVTRDLGTTADNLRKQYHLTALYAPEHGIRGDAGAGEAINGYTDARTGLPVYSLYGETKKPSEEMLKSIDLLVMDTHDIGCRYYTFLSTMRLCMEACAENGKAFAVLDRPNPVGGLAVEGNLIHDGFFSFVGAAAVPQRHGMTLGELAHLINKEYSVNCELYVLPMENWRRDMYFDKTGQLWVNPSPNMPGLDAAFLYPGTCLFEGTNLSEARGTTKPFEMFGAPWLDGENMAQHLNALNMPGLRFRPVYFKPAFSKHAGRLCQGVQAHITDRDALKPLEAGLTMLEAARDMSGDNFEWLLPFTGDDKRFFIDLLAGNDLLRRERNFKKYISGCLTDSIEFMKIREKYLIY